MRLLWEERAWKEYCDWQAQDKYETLAAMKEARDIASGKIPAKIYNSVADLMEDLNRDDED